jgi:type III secretion protein O
MTYILEDLLSLREHREKKALHTLLQSISAINTAEVVKDEKNAALQTYMKWRAMEENRLFEELRHGDKNIHDLQNFNLHIEYFLEEQGRLHDALTQAEKDIEEAKEKKKIARKAYIHAHRELEKLKAHKNAWLKKKYFETERKRENEQDEINSAKGCISPVF